MVTSESGSHGAAWGGSFDVPLMSMSDEEVLTGLRLRASVFLEPQLGCVACLYVFFDLEPVGFLVWTAGPNESGDITRIWTAPEFRRRKVATAMKKIAEVVAEERGWTPPAHSDSRTPEGNAWAMSLGAASALEILPGWGAMGASEQGPSGDASA